MYYFSEWNVLVVDDEPDVLAISRLALEDCVIYGLPLVLHMAHTKTEAIELLHDRPDLAENLALAFVDVVMETDDAGLELCTYIRDEIGNRLTQLFIRTGQPGLAPEREVIDHYEINGYFTKIEATEEKLYSLVKSGVRQFLWSHLVQVYLAGFNEVLNSASWRQKIEQLLHSLLDAGPDTTPQIPVYIAFDNHVLVQRAVDDQAVDQWRHTLEQPSGLRFTMAGNQYTHDGENEWGIHIVAGPTSAEVLLICHTAFAPPEDLVTMTHDFFQGLATLWKRAR